jgi:hypothetical protein
MTIRRMRIACCITKATNTHTHTHTGCVILIALSMKQWLHVRASMLRYTYMVHYPSGFLFRHTVMEAASLVSSNSLNTVRYGSKKCSSCRTIFMLLSTAGPKCCTVIHEQTSRNGGTAKYVRTREKRDMIAALWNWSWLLPFTSITQLIKYTTGKEGGGRAVKPF